MPDATRFKIGFLRQIAELGLVPSDFTAGLEKRSSVLSPITSTASVARDVGPALLSIGLGLPLVGGLAGGYVGRSVAQADDETLDEVKTREMTAMYRQLARRVRERTQRGQR